MKISILLIAGRNEQPAALAMEAARSAWPDIVAASADSLESALKLEPSNLPEVLVLADCDPAQIAQATRALDQFQLPRWAVVAMGSGGAVRFAEVIPESEWSPRLLDRVFRSSLAQQLLRRDNERLRRDLLAVGTRVVHDLRSPLGGILSAAEATNEMVGRFAPDERPIIQSIFDSTADLVKVIKQLALLAKASANPDLRERFKMGDAAGHAIAVLEGKTMKAGAIISQPPSWPEVAGDRSKAESVWVCLIENALRHGGNRPKIDLSWSRQGEEYRFCVQDNGDGVAREKRRYLFYPFHLLNEPNAPRGFGLPIVERLVHLQGGKCGYEPGPGGGAVFFFTLPA